MSRSSAVEIAKVALDRAEAEKGLPLPGYTHIQRAVVSSAGMWWAGWAEAFIDNAVRARRYPRLIDANPLGTAAGYGVNLPLDRDHTTQALGFARMQVSPIYAQLSRGKFEMAALEALGSATLDLRRLAWDLSLFTSAEFGFVALPAQYTTGSSIMPNKRNPDVIELMRATHASVAAARTEIEQLLSLPSGYHRDLQASKGAIFHGFGRGLAALELLPDLLANLEWREDRMRAAIDSGMYATDVAVERLSRACRSAMPIARRRLQRMRPAKGARPNPAWRRAYPQALQPTCAWTNCASAGKPWERRESRIHSTRYHIVSVATHVAPTPPVPLMSESKPITRYLVMAMRTPGFSDEVIAPHLAFLEALRAEGKLEMTGGFSDKSGGAYVLRAASMEQAQVLAAADPLATSGSSMVTVYEWNTR